ncbi:hypothetical protein LZ30DRAFT_692779 [Colletotrichum cereale]|nr:hypothetical protein LZ30DRAFT_692779 [Colletotrichum cereale]
MNQADLKVPGTGRRVLVLSWVRLLALPDSWPQWKIGWCLEDRLQRQDTGHGAVHRIVYGRFSSLVLVDKQDLPELREMIPLGRLGDKWFSVWTSLLGVPFRLVPETTWSGNSHRVFADRLVRTDASVGGDFVPS